MQSETQANDTAITCSFIVALYNRADTIERCLDYLVYQRTQRTFEIIVVDDQSTDASPDIARVWQARHPDRIRVVRNPDKGVANAKNLGIKEARGEFVSFVDSDDYVDYRFLDTMTAPGEALSADLIVAPIWSVNDGGTRRLEVLATKKEPPTQRNLLNSSYFFLHGKLIRRTLFADYGPMPNLRISEDTSWVFPAIAKTRKIVYVDSPGYFYELSANSISASFNSRELVDNALSSSEIILAQTPREFRTEAEHYVMRRILWYYMPKFKGFTNDFRDFLNRHPDTCIRWSASNGVASPATCTKLAKLVEEEAIRLPTNVFVGGFGTRNAVEQHHRAVFESETVLEVLDETNCRVDEAPASVRAAHAAGDWRFVNGYFALRRIFEKGGVYLDASMEVVHPFWQMSETPAFFAYATEHSFSEKVFGGLAGQEVFRLLLRTYNSGAFDAGMSLADRIRIVVTGITNLPNNAGFTERGYFGVSLCPVSEFVFSDDAARQCALTVDCEAPLDSVRAFDREMLRRQTYGRAQDGAAVTTREKKLRAERDYYKKQITAMETSVVWRMKEAVKRPLSKIGFFSPLKRMGNFVLRLARV